MQLELVKALAADYRLVLDENGTAVLHGADAQWPVAALTGPAPETTTIRVFVGKGGWCAVVTEDAWRLFVLPEGNLRLANGSELAVFSQEAVFPQPAPAGAWQPPRPQQAAPETAIPQALILGAGIGTRILPLTEDELAKPALPLGDPFHEGKPTQTVIGALARHVQSHGVQRCFVNLFYGRQTVRDALATQPDVVFLEEARATGTAGPLANLLRSGQLDETQPLLVLQGDAVTNADLSALVAAHNAHHAALTIGVQRVDDGDVNKFGIIATDKTGQNDGGNVFEFLEKPEPDQTPHRLGSTGFYVIAPEAYPWILKAYEAMAPKSGGEPEEFDFAHHVFPALLAEISQGTVLDANKQPMCFWAEPVSGYWSDIGNPLQYALTYHQVQPQAGKTILWPGAQQQADLPQWLAEQADQPRLIVSRKA